VLKQIGKLEDCKQLFDALNAQFHRKELSNRLYTTLKLMSFEMKDSSTKIQDHTDSFNDLTIDLKNLEEDLTYERKTVHLLSSLPVSYQSLSRVLLHSDRNTITYNEVISALLIDDLQTKIMAPTQPSNAFGTTLNVTCGRSQQRMQGNDGKGSGSKERSKSRGKFQDKKNITC
jgi:hypothetical protein